MFKIYILFALQTAQITANIFPTENQMTSRVQLPNAYELEIIDLLGLGDRASHLKRLPSTRNSASKFLLEIYQEISNEENDLYNGAHEGDSRHKRAAQKDTFRMHSFRTEIEKCNNIITLSSKKPPHPAASHNLTTARGLADNLLQFNSNDVPKDLQLVYAELRLYQDLALGKYSSSSPLNVSVAIYEKVHNRKQQSNEFHIMSSLNSTTAHKGWLQFNVTCLLGKWLQRSKPHVKEILVGMTLQSDNKSDGETHFSELSVRDIGLVGVAQGDDTMIDLQPFIVGYFNGPELMAKIQKLRFKRELLKRKRRADYFMPPTLPLPDVYHTPKTCERLNFTLDFKDLHMHNWIIAPKKFEAYFCGGECNFPLNSHMNATNHAIVQTLMHLKQPNLPKPCCVPTVLGSISILHYLNDDSVNLSKYPQSVAKECGCH